MQQLGRPSQDFQGNPGACFRIGQGMMVLCQVVSAAEGYCLQLMVGQVPAECKTGSAEGAMERVTGVLHAVGLEGGFQASFVKRTVVGH